MRGDVTGGSLPRSLSYWRVSEDLNCRGKLSLCEEGGTAGKTAEAGETKGETSLLPSLLAPRPSLGASVIAPSPQVV